MRGIDGIISEILSDPYPVHMPAGSEDKEVLFWCSDMKFRSGGACYETTLLVESKEEAEELEVGQKITPSYDEA